MSTLTYFGNQSVTGWRGMINHLKKANEEFQKAIPIMTQYERASIGHSINEKRVEYRPAIEAGALAVWNGAKSDLKAALKNVEVQRRKVRNSFDSAKLESEMSLVNRRMELAAKGNDSAAALKDLYTEYQESGDRIKQRAAAEVFQGVLSLIPQGAQDSHGASARLLCNRITQQAAADLVTLQTSPELTKAHEEAAVKVAELQKSKNMLYEAAGVLGDLAPNENMLNSRFIDALATVQNENGQFKFANEKEN
jgi:hypothetical protein